MRFNELAHVGEKLGLISVLLDYKLHAFSLAFYSLFNKVYLWINQTSDITSDKEGVPLLKYQAGRVPTRGNRNDRVVLINASVHWTTENKVFAKLALHIRLIRVGFHFFKTCMTFWPIYNKFIAILFLERNCKLFEDKVLLSWSPDFPQCLA